MRAREFHAELPSTQTEAVRRAREGAPSGLCVVAGRQTAGRGRLDHRWASPEGGLYLSVVLAAPGEQSGLLPLAVGSGIAGALSLAYSVAPVVKWPNDLFVVEPGGARKLGGILVDEVASPTLGRAAVVGVGLNVAASPSSFAPELGPRTASLAELLPTPPPLREVEERVVAAVEAAAESLGRADERAAVLEGCRRHLYGMGRRATVDGGLHGVIAALGDGGELWLSTERGPVAVRSGDLVVEEA